MEWYHWLIWLAVITLALWFRAWVSKKQDKNQKSGNRK